MFARNLIIGLGLIFASGTVHSAEIVCLKTGSCLCADSHVRNNGNLSVRIGAGSIDFSAEDVASIEVMASPVPDPTVRRTSQSLTPHYDPQVLLGTAAYQEGVDADFVRSVAKVESDFQQDAVSRKGALGLMQIMPSTAMVLGIDAKQPGQNALGGVKYLKDLLIKYHGNSALALAAYNAGPGAVQRFGGVPPYEETRSYILKVTREYDRRKVHSSKQDPPSRQSNQP